ncbi:prolyl oligopeptidase family serine peptidase [uncultured Shimia sp.]|uniref:prolyl oligopeptidase family serine peptidase n=1 Tax=uncultured Shimia sp. TaxID=573152 RepID=UPI0026376353|nr:prolyl oligopeptidase family serine peptidase [uncultured Shimia sp.]
MIRVVVLFLAVVVCAGAGLFVWTAQSAKSRNAEAIMPVAEHTPIAAPFVMESATQFHVRHLKDFRYEPSEKIQTIVPSDSTLDGITPVKWHYVGPQVARPVPLVVLFHGRDRTGLSMIEMWYETARNNGFAILAPTAPSGNWPYEEPSPYVLEKMIDQLHEKHQIDREKVFLFGHSAGAVYAQALLNKTKGPWRAAALHGGFLPASHQIVPQEAKPYRAYVGQHETGFELADIRATGEEMAKRGVANDLIVIPQHTHWFYDIGDQIAADSWAWFKSLP